jgi:hypothetical protein
MIILSKELRKADDLYENSEAENLKLMPCPKEAALNKLQTAIDINGSFLFPLYLLNISPL